jgi:hypothetical protein
LNKNEKKDERKKTRSAVNTSGDLFDLEFEDKDVKIRFNVAKYRFSIFECNSSINSLVLDVSNKLHFGQRSAIVSDRPPILPGGDKHRIFVNCLRIQLKKRRFIYLD